MNIRLLLRAVMILLLLIATFMILPIIVAICYQEFSMIPSFLFPIIAVLIVAIPYLLIVQSRKQELAIREGFLLVGISWIGASFLGAFPFWLSNSISEYTNAFFESVSGFTTTGASILTHISSLPKSILFWRSLTHWLGGMGIIVLAVAILPLLGIGTFQIFKAEAPGPKIDKLTPKIANTAKILWISYLLMTVAEVLLLLFGGMSVFDAITHSFGTVATGGFSTYETSIGHYNSTYIDVVITIFMILAGVNFIFYYKILFKRSFLIFSDREFTSYITIFFSGAIFLTLILLQHGTFSTVGKSLQYAFFQVASILTTTGYTTADFDNWPSVAKAIIFILMFIGGSTGSTSGGIKIMRIILIFKIAVQELRTLIHPKGVFSIKMGKVIIPSSILRSVGAFVSIYMFLLLMTTLIVSASGVSLITAFSTALATLGNIGPGFDAVGASQNYAFYSPFIKWFLSIIMIIGRLEIFTILVIFTPYFARPHS